MIDMQQPVTTDIAQDQLSMMSKLVERAIELSCKALFDSNILLARNVIEADKAINSYEIDIDNSTYGMLVVSNIPPDMLRSIISIQKINAMLERIGDHAVNIAESAMNLAAVPGEKMFFQLPEMADLCRKMLNDALSSFFKQDIALAQKVLERDDAVDQLNITITDEVKAKILSGELGEMSLDRGMELVRVCKNLERVADLSTNIAEETNFSSIGRVVKHHAVE